MGIPLYLAMTAAEFRSCDRKPDRIAWMACHFSPYGTGLTNLPSSLPPDSLLIVNDRTPICGHDPGRIRQQLLELAQQNKCRGVLLDFQRKDQPEAAVLAKELTQLPCPVAVSDLYARDLACPVFLSAPGPDCLLGSHLEPWQGREIWLEAALTGCRLELTQWGCSKTDLPFHSSAEFPHRDGRLHCGYRLDLETDKAVFTLSRDTDDLNALLEEAEALSVTQAVGLYQELCGPLNAAERACKPE